MWNSKEILVILILHQPLNLNLRLIIPYYYTLSYYCYDLDDGIFVTCFQGEGTRLWGCPTGNQKGPTPNKYSSQTLCIDLIPFRQILDFYFFFLNLLYELIVNPVGIFKMLTFSNCFKTHLRERLPRTEKPNLQ